MDFFEAGQQMAAKEEEGFTETVAQHLVKAAAEHSGLIITETVIQLQHDVTVALMSASEPNGLEAIISAHMLERVPQIMVNALAIARSALRSTQSPAPAIPRPAGPASAPGTRRGG